MAIVGALVLACALALGVRVDAARAGTAPSGFTDSVAITGLVSPTAVRFSSDGRIFVAEKSGLIKVFDGVSDRTPTVFADLRTNVHNFWDRGLLGLALDPAFPSRPYVYVLYTYDHVLGSASAPPRWGTAGGTADDCPTPPGATTGGCVVSGRLSRLTAAGDTATGPEKVLIEGWCQQYPSHSVGGLAFGSDGALYVSGGEGAGFDAVDDGQAGNPCGDPPGGTALAAPTAEGGALRAQDLRTASDPVGLSGSLLRVDPATGAGLPDNPLAGSADPNARRIVAYGFRNPFRIAVRPGTSDVWLGDVGWATFEEIDRVANAIGAVANFGWPCYEGPDRQPAYDGAGLAVCENLYAQPGAVTPPVFAYRQASKVVAGDPCPAGPSSGSGLAFGRPGSYPAAYDGALFFADYTRNCIWVMRRGTDGLPNPGSVTTFVAGAASPVDLQMSPGGELYYVDLDGGTVHHVRFTGRAPAPTPRPPSAPVIAGLGDSYSSGEANPLYDRGTDVPADRCHRSFLSWQRLIGVRRADHLACSGAKLQDLASGQHRAAPDDTGQLTRLRQRANGRHIDWVVLSIGGNDLGFAGILRDCIDPHRTCLPQSEQLQKLQLQALEPRLAAAYRSASTAAGGARVAVVGYPYLFPSPASRYVGCRGVSRVEKLRVRHAQDLVEGTLRQAASEAGARYVSVLGALRGRELCTRHSWMAPLAVAGGHVSDQQQAHPTACGQAAIARIVADALALRRTVYGCDAGKGLRVVIVGDTAGDGRSADLRVVASAGLGRQRLRNIDVPLTRIARPRRSSVATLHVYDARHFSADIDAARPTSSGADRIWYAPTGSTVRKLVSCSLRYGCSRPARAIPTVLRAVRLLNARGTPRIRPRRFVHSAGGSDLEFIRVRWAHWGTRRATGTGRIARCRTAPCAGAHAAVAVTASSLILCPVAGRPRTVGYYHALRYRRVEGGRSVTFRIPQRDDTFGACGTLLRR